MIKFTGKPVHRGIVSGKLYVWKAAHRLIQEKTVTDTAGELRRLEKAKKAAKETLEKLHDQSLTKAGEAGAAVFEAHQLLLEDAAYYEDIRSLIRTRQVNAEFAVTVTGEKFAGRFDEMEDAYIRTRSADIREVTDCLVEHLFMEKVLPQTLSEPSILLAENLSPAQLMELNREKLLAVVTVHGSENSHTSILARMMDIPTVVQIPVELSEIHSGMNAVVDGSTGELILEPSTEILERKEKEQQQEKAQQQELLEFRGKESRTRSGKQMIIFANIGNSDDLELACRNDASGIGLFRSEFLYLDRQDFPSEEVQYHAYCEVLQRMKGKKVIIRTMDIGADKRADYFHLTPEENPALGCRAVRLCLKRPEIFKVQLRALLRAAADCENLSMMYPLITSVEEIREIQKIVQQVQQELCREQISCRVPEQGIMIETPAAVMISEELAELVDFFSIGTNDLTQYTLAVDRQNDAVAEFYNSHHQAVLRMIEMTVQNANKQGKPVGICGELGADITLTAEFIRMGVDALSVSPSMILRVRKAVRETE